MYIYGAHVARVLIAPDNVQQVLSAVHLVRIEDEKLEHIELLRSQIDLAVSDEDSSALAVDPQVFHLYDFCFLFFWLLAGRTAHDGLDACFYFQNVERLCDVIICAVFQSQDFVHVLALCGQHDDRNVGKFTDLLADGQSVQLWQHQIQKDHIVFFFFCHGECFLAVVCAVNLHAVLLQAEADSFYDQFFIINYKNFLCHFFSFLF